MAAATVCGTTLSRFALVSRSGHGCWFAVLRKHWGPINEKAVTIKKEADDLLRAVQELVEGSSKVV
jgi:hypothetical protein